jgi:Luciferase-like monooxygenase
MARTRPRRLGFSTRLLDQANAGERYRLATDQIVHAERHGFDSAWVAQHHFDGDEGGLHVVARTSRIRLGTGIVTLPLDEPVRVAPNPGSKLIALKFNILTARSASSMAALAPTRPGSTEPTPTKSGCCDTRLAIRSLSLVMTGVSRPITMAKAIPALRISSM